MLKRASAGRHGPVHLVDPGLLVPEPEECSHSRKERKPRDTLQPCSQQGVTRSSSPAAHTGYVMFHKITQASINTVVFHDKNTSTPPQA